MKEEEALELSIKFAEDGREGNREAREKGRKCLKFVKGEQWDAADVASLESQGAVALTINHCLAIRDNLAGRERQNRKDYRIRPVKGANATLAAVLTAMVKHAMEDSKFIYIESDVFTSGITTGRGFRGLDVDFMKDPLKGDLIIEQFGPFSVDPDPLSREFDLNKSGKYINCYRWVDKDEIHARYPDKVDELGGTTFNKKTGTIRAAMDAVKKYLIGTSRKTSEDEEIDIIRYQKMKDYRYFMRKSWFKDYQEVFYWIDYQARTIKRLTEKSDVTKAKESERHLPERFKVIKHVIPVLQKVVAIEDVLLEHTEDPFKFAKSFGWVWEEDGPQIWEVGALFPVAPYYPYFEDGAFFGKIDNLIGPQIEENKRRTQFLRIITSAISGGWLYKKNSLDPKMIQLLENFGARPGILIEYDGEKPQRIEPGRPPMAQHMAAMTAKQDMKEIASVNVDMPAFKASESGRAVAIKTSEGMVGNEIVYDNFDYSRMIFGQVLLEAIRCGEFYSQAEISAIIDEEELIDDDVLKQVRELLGPPPQPPPPPQPAIMELAKQRFGPQGDMLNIAVNELYQKRQAEFEQKAKMYDNVTRSLAKHIIIEKIEDVKSGRYGVAVTESPNAPTIRAARFMELMEIEKIRPNQIPFEQIILASDLPNKKDIIAAVKQNQAQMALPLPAGGKI